MLKIRMYVMALAILVGPVAGKEAKQVPGRQFKARCVLFDQAGGKRHVVGRPELLADEGEEAEFLMGGRVTEDMARDAIGGVDVGLDVKVKIWSVGEGRLRIAARLGRGEVVSGGKSGLTMREQAVQTVREVKAGETVALTLEDGTGVEIAAAAMP